MPPNPDDPPYLSGESGTLGRRTELEGRVKDLLADVLTAPTRLAVRDAARLHPPKRTVLVTGVLRPERRAHAHRVLAELGRTRHELRFATGPGEPGAGKWQNLRALLHGQPLDGVDWLLVVDDDVVLPRRFLDSFLFCAERHDLVLAQPAHRFASNAAWRVTRRRPGVVVHETCFVEIGPVTAIRNKAFDALLPFPDLEMGWGLDAHWAALAGQRGWPIGVVDLTPVRHTRPVATDYPRDRAIAEARRFLHDRPYVTRDEAGRVVALHRDWR